MARRSGLFDALEGALRRGFYDSPDDAIDRVRRHQTRLQGDLFTDASVDEPVVSEHLEEPRTASRREASDL
jgi:DNA sulfur modification protein DndC